MYYGYSNELYHHGILGQRWGFRRYQNSDGSLTPEGKIRYAKRNLKNAVTKNVEKWGKDSNHNVLYVTGASGSGKSTTAMGLANKQDSIIHLDTLLEKEEHGEAHRNKDFERFCESKGIKVSDARDTSLDKKERWKVIDAIGDQIEPYGKQCYKNGKRVIVEGVQLADDTMFPNKSYFNDRPVIMLHSGKVTSNIRAAIRDNTKLSDIVKDMTDKERREWYNYVEDNLKRF